MDPDPPLPVIVAVFPLEVRQVKEVFPEMSERRRRWMSPKKAADKVREPELKRILSQFSLDLVR